MKTQHGRVQIVTLSKDEHLEIARKALAEFKEKFSEDFKFKEAQALKLLQVYPILDLAGHGKTRYSRYSFAAGLILAFIDRDFNIPDKASQLIEFIFRGSFFSDSQIDLNMEQLSPKDHGLVNKGNIAFATKLLKFFRRIEDFGFLESTKVFTYAQLAAGQNDDPESKPFMDSFSNTIAILSYNLESEILKFKHP